jgi:hypothetical protein
LPHICQQNVGRLSTRESAHGRLKAVLERAIQRLGLSARGYHRILKVACTLADMSGGPQIEVGHITEALALTLARSARDCSNAEETPDIGKRLSFDLLGINLTSDPRYFGALGVARKVLM